MRKVNEWFENIGEPKRISVYVLMFLIAYAVANIPHMAPIGLSLLFALVIWGGHRATRAVEVDIKKF